MKLCPYIFWWMTHGNNFFEKNKIMPYTIYYEDFIEKPTWIPLIEGVLDFLQISYTLPLDITTSRVKQSPDTTPLSYREFINQALFKKLGYRDKLWGQNSIVFYFK